MQEFKMSTPQELRAIRLKNDYKSMLNIRGDIVDWKLTRGSETLPQEFEITFNIRSIIDNSPTYRNNHVVKIVIPSEYPKSAPEAHMITKPFVFHPNWYTNGKWCHGTWFETEGLAEFTLRLAKTLQYDKDITNENSAANGDANTFYIRNKNRDIFPTDKQNLPDPTEDVRVNRPKKKFQIEQPRKKKSQID